MEQIASEIEPGGVLETDVCVIGAGAAGITLALELGRAGRDVLLLEGGGEKYDARSQHLYAGLEQSDYAPPGSHYLTSTRLRYLGGTTNHWNGWCRRLDRADFEPRAWVAESGWPISFDELAAHYEAAASWAGIPTEREIAGVPHPRLDPALCSDTSPFEATLFRLSEPRRFRIAYREELQRSERVTLILRANATELQLDESQNVVRSVVVRPYRRHALEIRARIFVLATGTIENARILLASRARDERGVGNSHDLVGRYFMEHLRVSISTVLDRSSLWLRNTAFLRRRGTLPELRTALRPRTAIQVRERLLNSLIVFEEIHLSDSPLAEDIVALRGAMADDGERHPILGLRTNLVGEQSPSPASRVRLIDKHDPLGMPRTALEWTLRDSDLESLLRLGRIFANHLGATAAGRARVPQTLDDVKREVRWSPHQMGTTRMHPDPRQGVVDTDCRVHGVRNLFIAGASAFPNAGVSNPTLSLLALTLRLSAHLQSSAA